jgi:hypothetical protein
VKQNRPLCSSDWAIARNGRLAELAAQNKQCVKGFELGLVLNFGLLSADPILQTTIHLRPLTVLAVDFASGLGYPRKSLQWTAPSFDVTGGKTYIFLT